MLSCVLEDIGYNVAVIGGYDVMVNEPDLVGRIAVEKIPPTSRSSLRRVAARFTPSRSETTRSNALERAATRSLRDHSPTLVLALDPLALSIAQNATHRLRASGLQPTLGYDRSRALPPGSREDQREASAIEGVDLGVAASETLALDERWPSRLRGRVSVVYSAPLELAARDRAFEQLKTVSPATEHALVGLFLPSQLSERQLAVLGEALGLMGTLRPVVFGSKHQHAAITRGTSYGARTASMQPSPYEEDLFDLAGKLTVVVCPSTWAASLPPSAAAVASAARGTSLVASHAVAQELGSATATEAQSAETLAEVVLRAARGAPQTSTATPSSHSRQRFGYGCQVTLVREQMGASRAPKLGIGPRNGNGQAWAWAQALRRRRSALSVEVFAAEYSSGRLAMRHETDVSISLEDWKRREWQVWWAHRLQSQFSHLLIEQGLTACGWLNGRSFFDDLPPLLRSGLNVGLVFRGSEIRDPAMHAARERWSPFADREDPLTAKLQERFKTSRAMLADFDVPMFVTTLDLLDDVPDATWLPQVLDTDEWVPGLPILERQRPVVLHAPSRTGQMKGSQWVDEACQLLHDEGAIDYRRLRGVPFADMPGRIRDADIVIDQLALGSYGVLALQAMASERLVIGHVSERVRERLSDPIPVLQAEPPDLRAVLEQALVARDWARDLARSGRDYVLRYHAGQESADRLLSHLVDA